MHPFIIQTIGNINISHLFRHSFSKRSAGHPRHLINHTCILTNLPSLKEIYQMKIQSLGNIMTVTKSNFLLRHSDSP